MFSFLTPSPATSHERPAHHANATGSAFTNPWADQQPALAQQVGYIDWIRQRTQSIPSVEFAREHPVHVQPVQVVKPDFSPPGKGKVKATWLGHAGFLVHITDDTSILFDPIFADRAGPSAGASGFAVGPARWLPPPCTVDDLPSTVRFVAISHNHYDHLDLPAILKLQQLHGDSLTYLVPLGNKAWFLQSGIPESQVVELDWWQEFLAPLPSKERVSSQERVRFTCVPAQHNSGRSLLDQRTTLWCGWIAELFEPPAGGWSNYKTENDTETESKADCEVEVGKRLACIYHTGDTGYGTPRGPAPFFADIGNRHGPIDLAMVPVWRGGSLSFVAAMGLKIIEPPAGAPSALSTLHASPSDALNIARDVKARHSIAMHFGTFVGSVHEATEPLVEIALLRRKAVEKALRERLAEEAVSDETTQVEAPSLSPLRKESTGWLDGRRTSSPNSSTTDLTRQETKDNGLLRRPTLGRASSSNSVKSVSAGSSPKPSAIASLAKASLSSLHLEQAADGEYVDEAGMWKRDGGFGWLDIGASAIVECTQLQEVQS
ncbi:beta-lactamase superfamily domain-containing protein [Auriculariales sp. MPI-PUGE-AT-0066]|nr:beta-lactamase superfamily domain-containing protein [Auriculariales sp. MPI-PUGE-AT-0066]